jgi:hypothetical protein
MKNRKKSFDSVTSQNWMQTMLYIVSNLLPVLVKKNLRPKAGTQNQPVDPIQNMHEELNMHEK